MVKKNWITTLFVCLIVIALPLSAQGETLKEAVSKLLTHHNRVLSAQDDLEAARERIRVTKGDWFPQLNMTTYYGKEDRNMPNNVQTRFNGSRDLDFRVDQLLYNFGKSNADLRVAKLQHSRSQATFDSTSQDLVLEAVVAYLELKQAEAVLKYAQQSEANIKKQTEMEDTRVKKGLGYSTDYLQSKTQLLGAQARRVRAEGQLSSAKNRAIAVFYRPAEEISILEMVKNPVDLLPPTLDEAEKEALEANPRLRASQFGVESAKERITSTRGKQLPTIKGAFEAEYMIDKEGIEGYRDEQLAKVELTWPINLGFTVANDVRASRKDYSAAVKSDRDLQDLLVEEVRNAWDRLNTARLNATLLRDQETIAAAFLELARKEQQLGRRSLLDVLAGETALINAQSNAAAAETEIAISSFTLLQTMGQLDLNIIESAQ